MFLQAESEARRVFLLRQAALKHGHADPGEAAEQAQLSEEPQQPGLLQHINFFAEHEAQAAHPEVYLCFFINHSSHKSQLKFIITVHVKVYKGLGSRARKQLPILLFRLYKWMGMYIIRKHIIPLRWKCPCSDMQVLRCDVVSMCCTGGSGGQERGTKERQCGDPDLGRSL